MNQKEGNTTVIDTCSWLNLVNHFKGDQFIFAFLPSSLYLTPLNRRMHYSFIKNFLNRISGLVFLLSLSRNKYQGLVSVVELYNKKRCFFSHIIFKTTNYYYLCVCVFSIWKYTNFIQWPKCILVSYLSHMLPFYLLKMSMSLCRQYSMFFIWKNLVFTSFKQSVCHIILKSHCVCLDGEVATPICGVMFN